MLIRPDKRKIVLNLRNPTKVTNIVPTAKVMQYKGRDFVVIPHNLTETRLLRNLGFDAPNPMLYYYGWPARPGWKPFEHQRETATFLALHSRAYCLDDMGTGKTMSSLWAFDYLRSEGFVRTMLIVAPLSTCDRTWGDQIFMDFPHLRFAVLHGTKAQRQKLLKQGADVLIINHDGVKVILDDLLAADIDVVLIDELSQAARNASTDRWKVYKKLIKDKPYVWGMTGTPIPNAPTDAWAQCRLITPNSVPEYFGHFRDLTMRQVTNFKWVARDNALDTVYQAMQPAIRHKRDECIDLPPVMYETRHADLTKEQARMFKEMQAKLYTEAQQGSVTAVNEAVKASKLIQIACIARGTRVLSSRGWVPIEQVRAYDSIWDGVAWVPHRGLVHRGRRKVVECFGVRMTLDHEVLTTGGWATAEEVLYGNASERFDRAAVRLPDSHQAGGVNRQGQWEQVRDVAMPLRLWDRSSSGKSISAIETSHEAEALWVQVRDDGDDAWERDAQDGEVAPVPNMGEHEAAMCGSARQRLEELRRAGDTGVRAVVRVVRELLGRYGADLPAWAHVGPYGQRWPILAGELPVGNHERAVEQHSGKHYGRNPAGGDDHDASRRDMGAEGGDGLRQGEPVRLDVGASTNDSTWEETFDIAYCGPRNRFVVQDKEGKPLIVHNCGAAYGDDDDTIVAPPKHRLLALRDIIEESAGKVIVFVPFRTALETVADILSRGYTVERVHGGISKNDRDAVFQAFQHEADPRVLVAQPAAMSHGLTLTAASTIVWFAPITSADTYEQANARITRPGQKLSQLIVHLQGTALEASMYQRLKDKTTMQGVLLDLFKQERNS